MGNDERKRRAAEAALEYVVPGEILGVGTGSTVEHFIELLGRRRDDVAACVSTSEATTRRLRDRGFRVMDLNEAGPLSVYVDGADEFAPDLALIKGGGGALTSEKIVAHAAETFVCIVDASKRVERLGAFPLPVEVLSMAREAVGRKLRTLGGEPRLREGVLTDHGNPVLDVHGLEITDPVALEADLDCTPGVVTCGLFARRRADVVLVGSDAGVDVVEARGGGPASVLGP